MDVSKSDFNKNNNRLLDLEKLRKRNRDLFDDDTRTTIPSKAKLNPSESSKLVSDSFKHNHSDFIQF